jgi:hypothetical protein
MTSQSILPLDLVRGDTTYCYLRVRSNSIVRVPLEVATMQQIFESNQTSDIANGFYFGLIAALILHNLFVFVSIKEKTYLYYVFYTFFVTVNHTIQLCSGKNCISPKTTNYWSLISVRLAWRNLLKNDVFCRVTSRFAA